MPVLSLCRTRLQVLGFYFRASARSCASNSISFILFPFPVSPSP
jgi:hypothetical protein